MRGLWWKLLFSLLVFTVVLVTVIMLVNRQILVQDIEQSAERTRDLIEADILHEMQMVDKAHLYFDTSISEDMKNELQYWRDYYVENPDFKTWDIADIKERTGMEFYIIDRNAVTILTTYEPSIGFDFNDCCERFVKLLDERRQSDQFYSDGLDNSAATKDLWKYSYWSTPDHQYILELGLQVEETALYKSFNFFDASERFTREFRDLEEIRIITDEGFILQSKDEHVSVETMDARWRAAYKEAATHMEEVQFTSVYEDVTETHRFIPYFAEVQRGNSTTRIVYMKFTDETKQDSMRQYTRQFIITLLGAIVIALVLLLIELKILMSTIKLATYDPLTGIYNRASYMQHVDNLISKQKSFPLGLLLIDLDNFKAINDQYGHNEGDEVLKEVARILKRYNSKTQFAVRFGGDEFAMIVEKATSQQLETISQEIIAAVKHLATAPNRKHWDVLSVSIGGTLQQEPKEEERVLYERADAALYLSKNNGKDRYSQL